MDTTAKVHRRRYTIARPESALALLSDPLLGSDDENENNEDRQLQRINDMLSSMIQEANEAVVKRPVYERSSSSSIPMIRKHSSSFIDQQSSKKSVRSAARPISYPSNLGRSTIPSVFTANNNIHRISSRKTSPHVTQPHYTHQQINTGNVLLESFKRLDSSLAAIDSLSRDLAPTMEQNSSRKSVAISRVKKNRNVYSTSNLPQTLECSQEIRREKSLIFDSRLSALLLLPLFHVPHVLISMVFDSITSYDNDMSDTASSSGNNGLSGMLIWLLVFAMTNLMVDNSNGQQKTKLIPSTDSHQKETLPGTFAQSRRNSNSSSNNSNVRRKSRSMKRNLSYNKKRYPSTQYEGSAVQMRRHHSDKSNRVFHPLELGVNLSRRNSI